MEEVRGRKNGNYIETLREIIRNEYRNEFVADNKVILPKRNNQIYDELSKRLKNIDIKYSVTANAVFHALTRHAYDFFEHSNNHDERYIKIL